MKHLKLFEGYSDKFYSEITEGEFYDLSNFISSENSFISLENKYISKLIKFGFRVEKGGFICSDDVKWMFKDNICIYQLEDDYFIVSISEHINNPHIKYYKCDQFDGLIKLLKDKRFINMKKSIKN